MADNPFKLIGSDWMLVTAGTQEKSNTMTARWGGLGVLWERRVAFCFIRPTRYTYEFIEQADGFSLSFFGEEHRKALQFCGTHSGRNTDKVRGAGLTPVHEGGFIYYKEARPCLPAGRSISRTSDRSVSSIARSRICIPRRTIIGWMWAR